MRKVYARRDMNFHTLCDDYTPKPFDQRYIARIVRAMKPNKAYFIDIKSTGRRLEVLRMLASKTFAEMNVCVKTFTFGDKLALIKLEEPNEIIV